VILESREGMARVGSALEEMLANHTVERLTDCGSDAIGQIGVRSVLGFLDVHPGDRHVDRIRSATGDPVSPTVTVWRSDRRGRAIQRAGSLCR
jgi:hypothetical protein